MEWTRHTPSHGWPYLHWLQAQGNNDLEVTFFARLKPEGFQELQDAGKLYDFINELETSLPNGTQVSPAQKEVLRYALHRALENNTAPIPRVMVQGRMAHYDDLISLFDIDSICPRVPETIQSEDKGQPRFQFTAQGDFGVIIDDGLPVFHQSLCYPNDNRSRFVQLLIQRTDGRASRSYDGRRLEQLRDGSDEVAAYRRLNTDNSKQFVGTDRMASHGAAVSCLAFGTNVHEQEEDALALLPLIGVQLPAGVIADSSGRAAPEYILGGLIWAIYAALSSFWPSFPQPKNLFVNLSIGAQGGADGPSFFSNWLDYIVDLYAYISEYHAQVADAPTDAGRMYISAAYGNAYRSNLVARRDTLTADRPLELNWNLMPEDYSSNTLELRADSIADLRLTLTAPDGTVFEGSGSDLLTGVHRLTKAGNSLGLITGFEDRWDGGLSVILGPTATQDPTVAVVQSGAWRIQVSALEGKTLQHVSLKLHRDDTPDGHRLLGRQSYFSHKSGMSWDDEVKSWSLPSSASPISREGTMVSFAGVQADTIFLVAARRGDDPYGEHQPATYSSAGLDGAAGGVAAPSVSELVDAAANLPGLRTGAVTSRGATRLSGTSAAAARFTRRLVLDAQSRAPIAQTHRDKLEPRLGHRLY